MKAYPTQWRIQTLKKKGAPFCVFPPKIFQGGVVVKKMSLTKNKAGGRPPRAPSQNPPPRQNFKQKPTFICEQYKFAYV